MNTKLINRIDQINRKGLYYNTACLKVTEGNDFKAVYEELLEFVRQTTLEEGCVDFFAAPANLESGEIMLWEVWENEDALKIHMEAEYTQKILQKNLIELKWNQAANMSNK